MYAELIWTRCGAGIELRNRQLLQGGGFKVFSASEKVNEAGYVDLPFLDSFARGKQTYRDPATSGSPFMDDAYLYCTPDVGAKYLLDFHPIPKGSSTEGDFSHRGGNFINQVFIGEFDDFYPYETFGNDKVWDAKARGEAYYYTTGYAPLPERNDLSDSVGYIGTEEIAAFVAEGRRDALMSAVAFLLSQYAQVPENRKFLVIRDVDSRHIELWVAAIESAFSPRMSSGLSFATRLDKFATENRYTVNLNGQFQPQIDLQSPNQKLRYRAMIVGADERDGSNASAARPLANSPFVLLDGKTKTLSVSVDAGDPYYRFVTDYREDQICFCREFLQTVDLRQPSLDILRLCAAYRSLSGSGAVSSGAAASALSILGQYKLLKTPYLEKLYARMKEAVKGYFRDSARDALTVLDWLEKVRGIVGDEGAKTEFAAFVCQSFAENAYTHPRASGTAELWNCVRSSAFAPAAAGFLTENATADAYESARREYAVNDWTAFFKLLMECIPLVKSGYPSSAGKMFGEALQACYSARNGEGALQLVKLSADQDRQRTRTMLLNEAQQSSDPTFKTFMIQLLLRIDPTAAASEEGMLKLCSEMQKLQLESCFGPVLERRAEAVTKPQEIERYLNWLSGNPSFRKADLTGVYQRLDSRLSVSDKAAGRVAVRLQEEKPEGAKCINSAHIALLSELGKRQGAGRTASVAALLERSRKQGFPSIEDPAYAESLFAQLFAHPLSGQDVDMIVLVFSSSAFYCAPLADRVLDLTLTRQTDLLDLFLKTAAEVNSPVLFSAFVKSLSETRQYSRNLDNFKANLKNPGSKAYFAKMEQQVRLKLEQTKGPSLFERLFSRGGSGKDEPDKRRKG